MEIKNAHYKRCISELLCELRMDEYCVQLKEFEVKVIAIIVFLIYIVVLVKLVVLKGPLFYQLVSGTSDYRALAVNGKYKDYNLVPLTTIRSFLTLHPSTSTSAKVFNLLGNIVLFIPFGFLLPIIFKRLRKFAPILLATFLVSLFFELFQLITHTGNFDVDDLILNSIGGLFGYVSYRIGLKFLTSKISSVS